ncbi:MAG: Uma2 family endonuclease [Blastocatellia bacterium]
MTLSLTRRPFTTTEYHQLIAAGVLTEDDRVELLNGEIIQMSAIGPRHAACVKRLIEFLSLKVRKFAIVASQDPIQLDDYSEPEPDISLLRRRADFYAEAHPTPADILIAIEVADTSLEYDRNIKLPSYAQAGIPEAWLVDLINDRIEVHSQPHNGIYQEVRIVQREQKVVSRSIPQLKLKAEDILG